MFFKKGLENSGLTFPAELGGSKMWWCLCVVGVGRTSGVLSQLEGELQCGDSIAARSPEPSAVCVFLSTLI